MGLSIHEQETVIQFNRDETNATIYTSDRTVMTRLNKFPDTYQKSKEDLDETTGEVLAVTYRVPKKLISFRSKFVTSRQTEEQKQAAGERLKRWNAERRRGEHDA